MMRIVPAILAYSQKEFNDKLDVAASLTDKVQIDIVDRSFGAAPTVELSQLKLPKQVKPIFHLMVENPESVIDQCLTLNAERIIFHYESRPDWSAIANALPLNKIGVAINPETDTDVLITVKEKVMEVLLMSVAPGASGHEFQWNVIKKIEKAKSLLDNRAAISMDGGIDEEKIPYLLQQKVDIAYIASAIFKAPKPQEEFYRLRGIVEKDERS